MSYFEFLNCIAWTVPVDIVFKYSINTYLGYIFIGAGMMSKP